MKEIKIHNKSYWFATDFKDNEELRHGFNALAKATFDFDFEDYYKSGYWNDRYIPYALLDEGTVVANVSVNILDFFVCGEMKKYIQIGTVMTAKEYRGRGLSKYLMDKVLGEWQDKNDLIYLFANDTVLDFYPKFGFVKKSEYQYVKTITNSQATGTARRLNMDKKEDRDLLFRLSDTTRPFSKLIALHNTGLVMFYASSFMRDAFYYIENLDTAIFAKNGGSTLYLNDIFSPHEVSVDQIISAMAQQDTDRVVLGFTPLETDGYSCMPYSQEDDTLFVIANDESVFDTHKLMLPILSHA